jgi:hypothetical protein
MPFIIPAALEAMAADSIAGDLVRRALSADAAGLDPDSLYSAESEVIADGEPRTMAPRFAGFGRGGEVQLAASRSSVTGQLVWTTIAYRWMPGTVGGQMTEGRATLIVGRQRDGRWRILHVHSSSTP